MKIPENIFKYIIGLVTVIGLRVMPHPPNVEPIMSTMMPFSKKWGWLSGMVFCLLSVISYDLITNTLGVWSIMTAGTYAMLGVLSGFYFKKRESSIKNYIRFSIFATLVFDAITGIGTGMLFFNQPFWLTFTGQVPFTMYHLGGNIFFSATVSPLLYRWVLQNPSLETNRIVNKVLSRA